MEISASLPSSIAPAFIFRASAPLMVAILSTSIAFTAFGSISTALFTIDAMWISSSIFWLLFEEEPSVPRQTFIPFAKSFLTGVNPLASFRFELGL